MLRNFLRTRLQTVFQKRSQDNRGQWHKRALTLASITAAFFIIGHLGIRFILWPQIEKSKSTIEKLISARMGADVTMDDLQVSWTGIRPNFVIEGLRFNSPSGLSTAPPLLIQNISGQLSWLSLYHLAPYFHEIHADNVQLYAQRDAKGIISVAGIPIHSKANDLSTENWLFGQNDIQMRNAKIFWKDEKNRKLKTAIEIPHLQLSNNFRSHQGELTALTPWSANPITIQASFTHRLSGQAGNWHDWVGQFSWNISALNLGQISKDISLTLSNLNGMLTSQGSLQLDSGKADGASIALTADQLIVQLHTGDPAIEFGRLETELTQDLNGGIHSVTTKTLAWRNINSPSNAALDNLSPITFRWRQPKEGREIEEFGFSSPKISVEDVARFTLNLPLPKKIHQWIKTSKADGELQNLEINWSENKSTLSALPIAGNWLNSNQLDFSVSAQLNGISFVSMDQSIPSVTKLTGNLMSNQKQGSFIFNSKNLALNMNNFLSTPYIELDSAKGELGWVKQKGGWLINAKQLKLSNSEITTNFDLSYLIGGPKQADQITLDMAFVKAKLATAHRYLPAGMDPDTKQYLSKAFESGDIQGGTLRIKGDPNQIPFPVGAAGEFNLHLPISQANFKPAPLLPLNQGIWSAFSQIVGSINMKQAALSIDIDKASYKKVALSNVQANISDVSAKKPILNIRGLANGDGPEFLEYLKISPIGIQQVGIAKNLSLLGPVQLDLGLQIPLSGNDGVNVDAQLNLEGNKIQWGSLPPLEGVKGKVRITEKNPEFENITANFLGGGLKISSANSTGDNSSFNISGDMNAGFIKKYVSENFTAQMNPAFLNAMSGSAKYDGLINFNPSGSQTNLKFDLRNWASAAPAPANKLAGTPMLGQISLRTYPVNRSNTTSMDWSGKLGEQYFLQGSTDINDVSKQAFGIGAPIASLPQQGIALNISSNELNLDTWLAFFKASAPSLKSGLTRKSEGPDLNIQISAQVKKVIALDREWDDLTLSANEKNDLWQLNLNSPQIAGQAQWHQTTTEQPSGLITGRFTRLKVPDQITAINQILEVPSPPRGKKIVQKSHATNTPNAPLGPNAIPSLDIVIDDLSWLKAKLGSVKVKTKTSQDLLKIESVQINNAQGNSNITGQWQGKTMVDAEQSVIASTIDIKDAGEMISRWTKPKSVEGGEGKLKASLNWSGPLFTPDYNSMAGNVSLELAKGRLLEVNTDGAKLLDVLSLQSLFRFATLDLQGSLGNLATKGTPFNTISSQFDITQGIAQTKQFSMILDQARVAMTGNINIPQQTQDLRITIFPTIDATAGSLAAFAINPIIGLGALVGQYLVTNQINRTMQSDYLIQGSWDKPEVVPLNQKGQPLDAKTLETIRTSNLLKEQSKPSLPTAPANAPKPSSALPK